MSAVTLCPNHEKVFSENSENEKRHFKPLASIALSIINPLWQGEMFVVYFNNDPYCMETTPANNEYCNDYKVSFDIIDNKYKFKTSFDYFFTNEDWKEWLEMGDKSYAAFLERLKSEEIAPEAFVKNIGGEPAWVQTDETPLNSKGAPMKFICQMSSYQIVDDNCGEEIYLFYDQEDKMAVQIHQID